MAIERAGKHILLVTTSYPWIIDGREAAGGFVADFAAALAEHARVTVVAPGLAARTDVRGAVAVHFFPVPSLPLSLINPLSPLTWPTIAGVLRAGYRTCEAIADADPVDHALALWALPCGHWAQRLLRTRGIPYSAWGLGSDIWTLGRIPIVRGVLRRVLREATYCFADGFALADDIARISARACEFLPSSRAFTAGPTRARNVKPPYRLAFLGRWHANKGVDLLLDALSRLDDQDWSAIEAVRIAGGGPLEQQVIAGVERLRAAGRPVHRQGFLDHDAAVALFDWADYVLLPSRIESIPVVFSDAMQARRPLIAMPVGDLPRLMHRYQAGVLSARVSPQAIAVAIGSAIRADGAAFSGGLEQAAGDFDVVTTAAKCARQLLPGGRAPG